MDTLCSSVLDGSEWSEGRRTVVESEAMGGPELVRCRSRRQCWRKIRMSELDQISAALECLYESVIEPEKWPQALETIAHYVGGHAVGEVSADPSRGCILRCDSVNVDPVFKSAYLNYYAEREVRLAPAAPLPVGAVITEQMLLEQSSLEKSEIFQDLLLPCDVPYFMMTWVRKNPQQVQAIAMERASARGPFQGEAIQRYSALVPHIIRSVKARELVLMAHSYQNAYEALIDRLPFGVILLDARGFSIECSEGAQRLFRAKDGLLLLQGRPRARLSRDDAKLQSAIERCGPGSTLRAFAGDTLQLTRVGRAALTVHVIPLRPGERPILQPHVHTLLLIVDPEHVPTPTCAFVAKVLNLSPAEAQLTLTLMSGSSVQEAAQQLGITVNTAKTQLKSVYLKTGCRRHGDLMKRVTLLTMVRANT